MFWFRRSGGYSWPPIEGRITGRTGNKSSGLALPKQVVCGPFSRISGRPLSRRGKRWVCSRQPVRSIRSELVSGSGPPSTPERNISPIYRESQMMFDVTVAATVALKYRSRTSMNIHRSSDRCSRTGTASPGSSNPYRRPIRFKHNHGGA
jgi:hypothetical protein